MLLLPQGKGMWSFSRKASKEDVYFVPARNETQNIAAENLTDVCSKMRTLGCFMDCNSNAGSLSFCGRYLAPVPQGSTGLSVRMLFRGKSNQSLRITFERDFHFQIKNTILAQSRLPALLPTPCCGFVQR